MKTVDWESDCVSRWMKIASNKENRSVCIALFLSGSRKEINFQQFLRRKTSDWRTVVWGLKKVWKYFCPESVFLRSKFRNVWSYFWDSEKKDSIFSPETFYSSLPPSGLEMMMYANCMSKWIFALQHVTSRSEGKEKISNFLKICFFLHTLFSVL